MTPAQSVLAFLAGLACVVVGLAWALGPWALVVCGVVLALLGLLLPVREPPSDDVQT